MNYHFGDRRNHILIYSQSGVGKSVSLVTLLKISNLKVRILAMETNCLPALEEGFSIHKIENLEEGRLIINNISDTQSVSEDVFIDQTDDSIYMKAVQGLLNFKGRDVVSGEEKKLGNALTWGKDTVLCIDGLTMLQFACQARGTSLTKVKKDPRMAFYEGQKVLTGYIYQLCQKSLGNLVVLAHEAISDEESLQKHPNLKKIHPALGTRSIVSPFCGRFSNVLYAKYDRQIRQYVWSADEADVLTVGRRINIKDKKYNGKVVTMSKLPADFSFEGYDWF